MTIDKIALLSRLDRAQPSEMASLARACLARRKTHFASEAPVFVKVSAALRLWNARLQNTRITNRPIRGAELLVEHLRALGATAELEQFGFTSCGKAGNLFFSRDDGEFVGLVIVERPEPSA